MIVTVKRIDDAYKMEATNETGEILHIDGSKALGASESAFRPMQLLLTSLGGCSAIDIINVLTRGRQRIDSFEMKLSGDRVDGTPAPFTSMNVHFILKGKIKEEKLIKAIELAETKYCSVYFSLNPEIDIRYSYDLESVE